MKTIYNITVVTNKPIQVCKYTLKGKLIAIYKSAYTAAKENEGCNRCSILLCCEGKQPYHGDFMWKYNK